MAAPRQAVGAPAAPVLKVAVVGHTNTGKTSLLRTLTRDAGFGEVSDRPGTTRHVEATVLFVRGEPLVELYDTPGLEDSIGLLELLDHSRQDRDRAWIEVVHDFLESDAARRRFEQEAKAIRQVLASDVVLYVIDARDRVLGKYRDELEILGRCARPVVPVLNFVAAGQARTEEWRAALTRVNMHAIAEFDTVVLNESSERRLFEKMLTLLDPFRATLAALIEERRQQRRALIEGAARLLADLLLDVAAFTLTVPAEGPDARRAGEELKERVRQRERRCDAALLELFRFSPGDYEAEAIPIVDGQWGYDLFSPASLKQFGIRAGGGAAAGALAGLTIDAMTGGLTLGAAAALGATVGALWSGLQTHGRKVADMLRGFSQLRVRDETLRLLALRQLDLIQALLRRGHAAQDKIRLAATAAASRKAWVEGELPQPLRDARIHPEWSRLDEEGMTATSDGGRAAAHDRLAQLLARDLTPPDDVT